jgi:hypothetical protein
VIRLWVGPRLPWRMIWRELEKVPEVERHGMAKAMKCH